MILKYDYFINESKISDIYVGAKIIFVSNIVRYKIKGEAGTIKSINKGGNVDGHLPHDLLEVGVELEDGRIITLNKNQLKSFDLQQGDDFKKKLDSGELIKYQATKEIHTIFKVMNFKPEGNYFDISYLDINKDNPEQISYIPGKKALGSNSNVSDIEKYRQSTRAGRIFKKLNPELTQQQIENYVDLYRAEVENYLKGIIINVVTGSDISHWYDEKNYVKGGGSLNSSCMRGNGVKKRLEFYDRFPDKIALALLMKGDKVAGRALIWKLDNGRVYMDRIYSVNGTSAKQLERYAKDNNMLLHKNRHGMGIVPIEERIPYYVTLKGNDWSVFNSYYGNVTTITPWLDTFVIIEKPEKLKIGEEYTIKLKG